MSDTNKLNLDSIPLGSPRPELPKLPELPALPAAKAAPPKPVDAKPAPSAPPAPDPVATTPATPTASSLWQLFEPNRTKGVIAAGIVSLLGGAATVKYLWPPKTPATTTAKVESETPAPLPAIVSPVEEPKPLPKVEPVTLVPIVPASGTPTTTIDLPKIDLPSLAPASSATSIGLPKLEVPTTAPASSATSIGLPKLEVPSTAPAPVTNPMSSPSIALPELVRTSGTEPTKPAEKPLDIKLPELVPSGGTTPPIPSPVSLPSIATPPATTPAPAPPAILPLPEVKVELPGGKPEAPKEIKIDPPAIAPTPVPAAPKLPEIGLPSLTETPAPKIEPAPPAFEIKPEVKPLPATELPAIGSVPVTATPASAVRPAPTTTPTTASIAATPPRTDYDVDLHYVRAGDSWAAISKQHFGDERYADALKGFNQNASLAGVQRVEVPPIHVLRKNYSALIGRPVEKGGDWGSITPSSATEPKRTITGSGYKMYTVPPGGRTLKEIAADAYGDEGRWGMVWDTNPKLVPDKVVPEGTKIYLTSQSKIGD